ncbi:hypothetical protein Salat_1886600 [Sesamum alatum]|uniref:Uncharacterized protein n=1 Tax=Sesamum alatum TaxID=300844 RepID=A0AAE1Y3G5_9LAMI|nr:hypothetical protein Salat_1886600 [Sesamum alatum]
MSSTNKKEEDQRIEKLPRERSVRKFAGDSQANQRTSWVNNSSPLNQWSVMTFSMKSSSQEGDPTRFRLGLWKDHVVHTFQGVNIAKTGSLGPNTRRGRGEVWYRRLVAKMIYEDRYARVYWEPKVDFKKRKLDSQTIRGRKMHSLFRSGISKV